MTATKTPLKLVSFDAARYLTPAVSRSPRTMPIRW
jgi:hypothetical protein